jgi:hypothetical protein
MITTKIMKEKVYIADFKKIEDDDRLKATVISIDAVIDLYMPVVDVWKRNVENGRYKVRISSLCEPNDPNEKMKNNRAYFSGNAIIIQKFNPEKGIFEKY